MGSDYLEPSEERSLCGGAGSRTTPGCREQQGREGELPRVLALPSPFVPMPGPEIGVASNWPLKAALP